MLTNKFHNVSLISQAAIFSYQALTNSSPKPNTNLKPINVFVVAILAFSTLILMVNVSQQRCLIVFQQKKY